MPFKKTDKGKCKEFDFMAFKLLVDNSQCHLIPVITAIHDNIDVSIIF